MGGEALRGGLDDDSSKKAQVMSGFGRLDAYNQAGENGGDSR